MTALKDIMLSASALFVVQFIFLILAPERYRSAVKFVISLAAVAVITSGLFKLDLGNMVSKIQLNEVNTSYDEHYSLVLTELEDQIGEYIRSILEEIGVNAEKVTVETTIDESLCISINKASILLGSEYEKDENAVRSLIAQKIGDITVIISFVEV